MQYVIERNPVASDCYYNSNFRHLYKDYTFENITIRVLIPPKNPFT